MYMGCVLKSEEHLLHSSWRMDHLIQVLETHANKHHQDCDCRIPQNLKLHGETPCLSLLTVPPKLMFSCFYTFGLGLNDSLSYSVETESVMCMWCVYERN